MPTPSDSPFSEQMSMRCWAWIMKSPTRYQAAGRLARWAQRLFTHHGWIRGLPLFPLSAWTEGRDFPALAQQSFHEKWATLDGGSSAARGAD